MASLPHIAPTMADKDDNPRKTEAVTTSSPHSGTNTTTTTATVSSQTSTTTSSNQSGQSQARALPKTQADPMPRPLSQQAAAMAGFHAFQTRSRIQRTPPQTASAAAQFSARHGTYGRGYSAQSATYHPGFFDPPMLGGTGNMTPRSGGSWPGSLLDQPSRPTPDYRSRNTAWDHPSWPPQPTAANRPPFRAETKPTETTARTEEPAAPGAAANRGAETGNDGGDNPAPPAADNAPPAEAADEPGRDPGANNAGMEPAEQQEPPAEAEDQIRQLQEYIAFLEQQGPPQQAAWQEHRPQASTYDWEEGSRNFPGSQHGYDMPGPHPPGYHGYGGPPPMGGPPGAPGAGPGYQGPPPGFPGDVPGGAAGGPGWPPGGPAADPGGAPGGPPGGGPPGGGPPGGPPGGGPGAGPYAHPQGGYNHGAPPNAYRPGALHAWEIGDAEFHRMMDKMMPKLQMDYLRTNKVADFINWERTTRNVLTSRAWLPNRAKKMLIREYIRDEADKHTRSVNFGLYDDTDWQTVMYSLTRAYMSEQGQRVAFQNFQNCKQGKDEHIRVFASRTRDLHRWAFPNFYNDFQRERHSELLQVFAAGLRHEHIRMVVLGMVQTATSLQQLVSTAENMAHTLDPRKEALAYEQPSANTTAKTAGLNAMAPASGDAPASADSEGKPCTICHKITKPAHTWETCFAVYDKFRAACKKENLQCPKAFTVPRFRRSGGRGRGGGRGRRGSVNSLRRSSSDSTELLDQVKEEDRKPEN